MHGNLAVIAKSTSLRRRTMPDGKIFCYELLTTERLLSRDLLGLGLGKAFQTIAMSDPGEIILNPSMIGWRKGFWIIEATRRDVNF